MQERKSYNILFLFLIIVAGCENSEYANHYVDASGGNAPVSVASTQAYIAQRYSRAELVCDLWFQKGIALDRLLPPEDRIFLNLRTVLDLKEKRTVGYQIRSHSILAELRFSNLHIDTSDRIKVRVQERFQLQTETEIIDSFSSSKTLPHETVIENESIVLMDHSMRLKPKSKDLHPAVEQKIFIYLECSIDAERN